ncbi:hypothetical protein CI109_102846 [Kwoniella shandongensis]|uniref:Uncharacterized protein n=1 Tax=Kwoniella shandongensis TaxID=1734106 RepID=A0A5M6C7S9_9TREE|nr:uncharacterized protein CI109_000036 [Kwoniella shandongensis]KAA5531198.1 hypothetical protein CI109_000036 [Kwoniella shandongensis]
MSLRTTTSAFRALQGVHSRLLHTSRAVFSSDLPPSPKSAEALGFTPQTNRQRQLPADLKIPITVSGQKDLFHGGGNGGSGERKQRQPSERRKEQTSNSNSNKRQPRAVANPETDADFFSDSTTTPAQPQSQARAPPSSGGPPRSRRSLKNISMDIVGSDTSLPPDVVRRQRRSQPQSQSPRGNRPPNAASGSGGQRRQSRDKKSLSVSPREKRVMLPRRQLTLEMMDHSSEGLFGKKKLLAGGRSAGSVGLGLSHARKVTSLRPTSSITSLPSGSIPILSPSPSKASEQAIQAASWAAALNPSINIRAKSRLSEVVAGQLGR